MSPQGAGTEPPSSHSPVGSGVTPSPSPAPSLPRAPFPSLHCQLQPHTACYQSFLNEHQHLIYFSKTYCFACMDPAWEAQVETSTQIPEPSAHQSVNAVKFGLHNPSCQVRTWLCKTAVLKLSTEAAPSAQHVTGHHSESPTDMRADVAKILPLLQLTNKSTGSGRLPNFSNVLSWMFP